MKRPGQEAPPERVPEPVKVTFIVAPVPQDQEADPKQRIPQDPNRPGTGGSRPLRARYDVLPGLDQADGSDQGPGSEERP